MTTTTKYNGLEPGELYFANKNMLFIEEDNNNLFEFIEPSERKYAISVDRFTTPIMYLNSKVTIKASGNYSNRFRFLFRDRVIVYYISETKLFSDFFIIADL